MAQRPKNFPPVAKLTLVTISGQSVTISTAGTTAGATGKNRQSATTSPIIAYRISWGDDQITDGTGTPPATLQHTYGPTVASAIIQFTVRAQNTLTASATLTIPNLTPTPPPDPPDPPAPLPPTVQSITRLDPSPTYEAQVRWLVTFSEPVNGAGLVNFQLVPGGVVNASLTAIARQSDRSYIVTAATGQTATQGSLGLNLSSVSGIISAITGQTLAATFAGDDAATYTTLALPAPQPPPPAPPPPVPPPVGTFYVATTGNDSDPGSEAQPWLTLKFATEQLTAGSVLRIRGGNYTGASNCIDSEAGTLNSGTSVAPIIVEAYAGESVTITPPDGRQAIRLTTNAPSNWIFRKNQGTAFILDGINQTIGGESGGPDLVYQSSGASFNTYRGLEIKRNAANGITFSDHNDTDSLRTDSNQIFDCLIHDNGRLEVRNSGYGIYVKTSHNLIQSNSIYANNGYGVHQNPSTAYGGQYNTVRDNRIYDNVPHGSTGLQSAYGIVFIGGIGCLAFNNLIYDNQGGVLVYNTTIDCGIFNNTIFRNVDEGVALQYYGANPMVRNNIVYGNGSSIIDYGGSGTPVLTPNTLADPIFVAPNADPPDLQLQSTSPAINAGVTITSVPIDYLGLSRPQGTAYTNGAYEFTPAPPPTPPPPPPTPPANPPTCTTIQRMDASPVVGPATVRWLVQFSEPVTGVDLSKFTLAATGVTGSSLTSVTGNGTDYTVTVAAGTASLAGSTLGLNLSTVSGIVGTITGLTMTATRVGDVYVIDPQQAPTPPPPPPPPPPSPTPTPGPGTRTLLGGWRIREPFARGCIAIDFATMTLWMGGHEGGNSILEYALPAMGSGSNIATWPIVNPVATYSPWWSGGGYPNGLIFWQGKLWVAPRVFYDMAPPPTLTITARDGETRTFNLPRQKFSGFVKTGPGLDPYIGCGGYESGQGSTSGPSLATLASVQLIGYGWPGLPGPVQANGVPLYWNQRAPRDTNFSIGDGTPAADEWVAWNPRVINGVLEGRWASDCIYGGGLVLPEGITYWAYMGTGVLSYATQRPTFSAVGAERTYEYRYTTANQLIGYTQRADLGAGPIRGQELAANGHVYLAHGNQWQSAQYPVDVAIRVYG